MINTLNNLIKTIQQLFFYRIVLFQFMRKVFTYIRFKNVPSVMSEKMKTIIKHPGYVDCN